MYISHLLLTVILYVRMSVELERLRRIRHPYPTRREIAIPPSHLQGSQRETIPFQDLNRYRVNPRLPLLIGPVTVRQNDSMVALDTMEQDLINEEQVCDALSDQPQEKDLKTVIPISSDMYAPAVSVIDLDAIERKERDLHKDIQKNIPKFITVTDNVS